MAYPTDVLTRGRAIKRRARGRRDAGRGHASCGSHDAESVDAARGTDFLKVTSREGGYRVSTGDRSALPGLSSLRYQLENGDCDPSRSSRGARFLCSMA